MIGMLLNVFRVFRDDPRNVGFTARALSWTQVVDIVLSAFETSWISIGEANLHAPNENGDL